MAQELNLAELQKKIESLSLHEQLTLVLCFLFDKKS